MITPRFLLADSDPDASLPFVVHTQAPQFFALLTPKFAATVETLQDLPDLRKALRGVNLYPGFLSRPENISAEQIMSLFHGGAHFMLEHTVGRDARHRVSDRDISVVWRESGTYAPKHLYAESEAGEFIIRTENPRMIIQMSGPRGEQIIWQEEASEEQLAKAIEEACEFRSEYVRREMAA